jgi:hypothetical protein
LKQGVLDLGGRSPRRYASLSSRVLSFMRDVFEARDTLTVEWAHVPDEYHALAAQAHETYVEKSRESQGGDAPPNREQVLRWLVTANSDAWTAVRKKWRLGGLIGVDFFVQLLGASRFRNDMHSSLTSSIEDMAKTVQEHPKPIYQKKYLLDLPNEMLHRIMASAHKRDAMRLGSACHRLYQIATSYVFEAGFALQDGFRMLNLCSSVVRSDSLLAGSRRTKGRKTFLLV